MAEGFTVVLDLQRQFRLDDQPALWRAVTSARSHQNGRLIVILTMDGHSVLWGPHQGRVVADALVSIGDRLRRQGVPFLTFQEGSGGKAIEAISALHRVDVVERCTPSRLFDSCPLSPERFPLVFSDFRRQICSAPEAPLPTPDLSGLGSSLTWPNEWCRWQNGTMSPASSSRSTCHPSSGFPFRGDEESALRRLEDYFFCTDGLRHYKDTRNGLLGTEYSSKFSPWLSIGALSVRRIWAAILGYQSQHGADAGSEAMKQELMWREFFLWSERCHPVAFHSMTGLQNRTYPYNQNQDTFARWTRADSGHPLIDATLRELNATGYLSNRVRQWVASDFVNRLKLPWLWGAHWFEWMLIDAVPSQNLGNWAYLAGVGSDPRSFGAGPRRFNLERQLSLYDPEGAYLRQWS